MNLTLAITWELTEADGNMPEFQTACRMIEDVLRKRRLTGVGEPDIPPYTTRLLCETATIYTEGTEKLIHIRTFGTDEWPPKREVNDTMNLVERLKETQRRRFSLSQDSLWRLANKHGFHDLWQDAESDLSEAINYICTLKKELADSIAEPKEKLGEDVEVKSD